MRLVGALRTQRNRTVLLAQSPFASATGEPGKPRAWMPVTPGDRTGQRFESARTIPAGLTGGVTLLGELRAKRC